MRISSTRRAANAGARRAAGVDARRAAVIVGHGSRERGFDSAMRRVARALGSTGRFAEVRCAYLMLKNPSIDEAVRQCVEAGADEVNLLPYFLLTGRHVLRHIPEAARALTRRYRGRVKIVLCPYLGFHPGLVDVVLDRIAEGKPCR